MDKSLDTGEAALSIVRRVHMIVMWSVFAIFHLTLAVAFLTIVWLRQISPEAMSGWIEAAYRSSSLPTLYAALGILGVSVSAGLFLYVRLWRRLYSSLTTPFVFAEIDEFFGRR